MAIVDLTPRSGRFGRILQQVPVGEGVLPHHPYTNRDGSKLYTTALGGASLYRIHLDGDRIEEVVPLDAGDCHVGEDLYFSSDGASFYLTCMGSDLVVAFDAHTDQRIKEITAEYPEKPYIHYPHGISAHEGIDRMVITETVSPDLQEAGSSVSVIELSSGNVLSTVSVAKSAEQPSAPVEVLFHPDRPIAYVTGMLESSIWALVWNETSESFEPKLVDDGEPRGQSWPLEMYFGPGGHLYVSWAVPGVVNEYRVERPDQLQLIRTLPAEPGAHHIEFSPDGRHMFVQNNLLNLDEMNAGTITAVDLGTGRTVCTADSFLERGLMPESIMLLGGGHHH